MIASAIKGIFNHQIFENILNKNRSKIIIYPNLNGFSVGILVFFCFKAFILIDKISHFI